MSRRRLNDGQFMRIDRFGYAWIKCKNNKNGRIQEHIYVAERVLGKPLPAGSVVHHIDGNRSNNIPENLIICENQIYHMLLHRRERALHECGHSGWRKCRYCCKYDDISNMKLYKNGKWWENYVHSKCNADKQFYRKHKLNPSKPYKTRWVYGNGSQYVTTSNER
jgi:hypothetical protein